MSEFDLDPQVQGAVGFGWEAHFRSSAAGSVDYRNLTITPVHPAPVENDSCVRDRRRGC